MLLKKLVRYSLDDLKLLGFLLTNTSRLTTNQLRYYCAFQARGNPTRLAPIPKPAPWRAVTAIEGVNVSRRAKVAKAATPIVRISPKLGFLGLSTRTATKATTRPSIEYLSTDVRTSPIEKSICSLILVPQKISFPAFAHFKNYDIYLIDPCHRTPRHRSKSRKIFSRRILKSAAKSLPSCPF